MLSKFVVAVRERYHDNPFHNFYHAFSVMHAAFLVMSQVRRRLRVRQRMTNRHNGALG